ncbi:MAG: adenosine deaminase family protein [Rubrivivax sp.]
MTPPALPAKAGTSAPTPEARVAAAALDPTPLPAAAPPTAQPTAPREADRAEFLSRVERFARAIPKVELHCHLLGTVQRDTLTEWVARAGGPISAAEIESFYTRGEKPVGVLRVLRALEQQLLASPDDLYRLTIEYLESASAHAVRYAEFAWNPTGCARDAGIDYRSGMQAIVAAIRDARVQWGIESRMIAAIDREAAPEDAVEMVEWVLAHRCDDVPGIGIDYRENDGPPEMFAQAYALARRGGLKATAHAGEFGMPWTHVRTAVDVLRVDRIDHGYTVVDDPAFAQRCAESGIVFTVVPTNSYYLRTLPPERWALDHPIRRMPGLGLRVHPNTDDPTLHLVDPTRAWTMMVRDFGFSVDDLRAFTINGIDAAWVDDSVRMRWRREHLRAFDELRQTHGL